MRLKVNITSERADGIRLPAELAGKFLPNLQNRRAVRSRLRGRVNRGGVPVAGPGEGTWAGPSLRRGRHTSDHAKKLETRSPHFRIPLTENVQDRQTPHTKPMGGPQG